MWGTQATGPEVAYHPFFSGSYSSGASGLLAALAEAAGSDHPVSWELTYEVPCPNCTDFETQVLVYFEEVGLLAVLTGGYGYDS